MKSNSHWVLFAEWCVDYEGGREIISVHHDIDDAVRALKKSVEEVYRIDAESNGYEILEDSDLTFDSGKMGDYVVDHITVSVIEVKNKSKKSRGVADD